MSNAMTATIRFSSRVSVSGMRGVKLLTQMTLLVLAKSIVP